MDKARRLTGPLTLHSGMARGKGSKTWSGARGIWVQVGTEVLGIIGDHVDLTVENAGFDPCPVCEGKGAICTWVPESVLPISADGCPNCKGRGFIRKAE